MTGFDPAALGVGAVCVAVVGSVTSYIREHRKLKADVDREEAMLPLDLVHQATSIARDQLSSMSAELERVQQRLLAMEQENDRLRAALAETREALDLAHAHLRDAWRTLSEVHPNPGNPPWGSL